MKGFLGEGGQCLLPFGEKKENMLNANETTLNTETMTHKLIVIGNLMWQHFHKY